MALLHDDLKQTDNSDMQKHKGVYLNMGLVEEILDLLTNPKRFLHNTNEITCDWDNVTRVCANVLAALKDQGAFDD